MPTKRERERVKAEQFLRFNPQASALTRLLEDEQGAYQGEVKRVEYHGKRLKHLANEAGIEVRSLYDALGKGKEASGLAAMLNSLPSTPVGNAQRQALGVENAVNADLNAKARTNLVADKIMEPARIEAGVGYRKDQLRGESMGRREKYIDQLNDINSQAGAYAAERFAELGEARSKENSKQRDRASDLTTTVNEWGYSKKDWAAMSPSQRQSIMKKVSADKRAPKAPKGSKGGKTDSKSKVPKLNANQRNQAVDRIALARSAYQQHYDGIAKSQGSKADQILRGGLQVGQLVDGSGNKMKLPKVTSSVETTAGFELAKRGYLTPKTERELRARGYRIPKSWQSSAPKYDSRQNDDRPASPKYGRG